MKRRDGSTRSSKATRARSPSAASSPPPRKKSRRRVMLVGVEVAGDRDQRLRLRVEQQFGEQPGLQRLAFALERGHELAFDLRAARSAAARRRDRNGARRA